MSELDDTPRARPARPRRRRLAWLVRGCLVLIAGVFTALFLVALVLDPYKDGKVWFEETHTQLGLQPCTFKIVTGKPCPSCGMTSSFALAIRGDFWHSAQANCVGTLLALFALVCIPWALASAVTGRLLLIGSFEKWLVRLVIAFVTLLFARWAIVLALAYF